MTDRTASVERKTGETSVRVDLNLDGQGRVEVETGVGFFDHMLTLFAVHGFFDLTVAAVGDLDVDWHHTVEDVGLTLGEAISRALGERRGLRRYGSAVTPMDEALAEVAIDLSNRPFLVWRLPSDLTYNSPFDGLLAKEFFRALSQRGGMNIHVTVAYGENAHHVIEAVFKALGRALDEAVGFDPRITSVRSSKGSL
jgi:imidazoleglycerol-phosphate dehydratase